MSRTGWTDSGEQFRGASPSEKSALLHKAIDSLNEARRHIPRFVGLEESIEKIDSALRIIGDALK